MNPTIRCSELDRVIACPASRTMSEIVAEFLSPSPYEGIAGHWRIASRLILELGAIPPPGGLPPPEVAADYVFPENSEWMVGYCFREVKNLLPADWSLEVEVPLAYEFTGFILSGHIDCLAVSPDGTHVIGWDWKLGYIAVDPAEMNNQVLGYLALIKRAYPHATRASFYVVQPRNDEDAGEQRVSSVEVLDAELDACLVQVEQDVTQSLRNATLINSGMVQCKYCPVGIQCPAIQNEIHLMRTTLTPERLAALTREPNDALLGDMIVAAKTVEGAITTATELLHERLDKLRRLTSGSGVSITRKIEGGHYKALEPAAILNGMLAIAPAHEVAKAVNFSTTRMKDLIAEQMNIPKSGKAAQTAASVFDARFRPLFEQGQRKKLIFS
jgi:hypothetical protein